MNAIDIKFVNQRLTSLIHRCLDAELLKTALFYAERLFALDGTNHESRHLLSKVMLKLDQPHSALHLVTRPQDDPCAGCLFMAAKCNEKLLRPRKAKDLMTAALGIMSANSERAQDAGSSHLTTDFPDLAIVHCKAGLLAAKASQKQEAIDSFYSALSIEPLLWEAWLGLCNLGATVNIDDIIKLPSQLQGTPSAFSEDGEVSSPPALSHPSVSKITKQYAMAPTPAAKAGPSGSGQGFFTPDNSVPNPAPLRFQLGKPPKQIYFSQHHSHTFESIASDLPTPSLLAPRPGGQHAGTRRGHPAADESGPANKRARTGTKTERGHQETRPGTNATASTTRRSTRLLMSNGKQGQLKHPPLIRDNRRTGRHRSRSVSDTEDTLGDALSPSSGSIAHSPRSDSAENLHAGSTSSQETKNNIAVAERYVFDLMKAFAKAQYHLSKYECKAALDCLDRLPQNQQMSPTAVVTVAKAHYELVEYVPAERAFKAVRRLDPYRLWDMDLYSTLLWHLRRNAQLSFLAQELLNINPKSPEAWIAVGNCFSLQKEHSQALVCFQRAAEMDPFCAYAYTLSGHESMVTDDVRKAIILFQTALGHDGRHYNAWYGLGSCYLKTGRYQMAQYHFERAVEIHPANAVLLGCLGMVHERQGQVDEALSLFNLALVTSPNNALVRYRRAKIMVQRGNYAAAEEDLVRLRDLSPSEPNVVLLLGKVYRLQGKTMLASRVLAVARDLDPRGATKIAKLIEETGRGRGTAVGGRGSVGAANASSVGETSIEGPSNGAIDVSMEGSLEAA